MKKTHFILWYLFGFAVSLGLMSWFGSVDIIFKILSSPFHGYLQLLRWLSNQTTMMKLGAWLIYLAVSAMPLILFAFSKSKKDKSLLLIHSVFSMFLLFATYGALNNFFINPEFIRQGIANLDNIRWVVNRAISIIIVFFILWIGFVKIQKQFNETFLSKRVVKFAISCGALFYGFMSASSFYTVMTIESADILVELPTQIVMAVRSLMLLSLIYSVLIHVVDYLKEGLSHHLVQQFKHISKLSRELLLFSIVSTIVIYVLKLILMSALQMAHFELSLPVLEIAVSAGAYIATRFMTQAQALEDENNQFV